MAVWDGYAHSGDTIRIKAQFPNTSGGFDSGLSPTVDILKDSDGSLLVDGANMTAFTNMTDVYYYDYTTTASGTITIKAESGDGRTAIAYWLIGSGSLPDAVIDSTSAESLVDDVWDEVLTGNTHNIQNSAGKRLRDIASQVIWTGTAQGAGTDNNQIQLDTNASSVDGAYDPALVAIIDGTGAGQCRLILQYDGTTRMATVDRGWKVQPDATSEFIVYAHPGREHVNEGLLQAATTTTATLNTSASSLDDNYIGQLIFIRSGTGEDQVRRISDYNGTTKIATVDMAWGVTPDATSAYIIIPNKIPNVSLFALETSVQENQSDLNTLLSRLTAERAINLDDLDAKVSEVLKSSEYTAPDNTGIGQLNAKLTTTRAAGLDNLDATISSRATQTSVDSVQTSVDAIDGTTTNIYNDTQIIVGGDGTLKVSIQFYLDGTTTALSDVITSAYYTGGSPEVMKASGISDVNGQLDLLLDNGGPYEIRARKAGYTIAIYNIADLQADSSITIYAGETSLISPTDPGECVIYENVKGYNTAATPENTVMTARISSLPFDYGGALYEGIEVTSTYDAIEKRASFQFPYGCELIVNFRYHGVKNKKIVVPASDSARLAEITEVS